MTVNEALREFSAQTGIYDERAFVLGIAMSDDGTSEYGSFEAVMSGVYEMEADIAPRMIRRDYVDGDKNVPASDRMKIRFKLCPVSDDEVHNRLLSAAEDSEKIRCVYISPSQKICAEGVLSVSIFSIKDNGIFGKEIGIELY